MLSIRRAEVESYLQTAFGPDVVLRSVGAIGERASRASIKRYGYGTPIAITFSQDGRERTVVLETMQPGPFGHEHRADRAQAILWDYDSYGRLPRHVPALDVGAVSGNGRLFSVRDAEEFFVITQHTAGKSYHLDLERMARDGRLAAGDAQRAHALARYLVEIHRRKKRSPGLYRRRIRELIGHGECIMGLTDSYPRRFGFIDEKLLRSIEDGANAWRWRLHHLGGRLCAVHGDFHPWNVLFRRGVDFSVLDRSRGEWGEAADDVTAMVINYLFFSLRRYGRLQGPFEKLFRGFWSTYEEGARDRHLRRVVAPFFAFRGLVIASPLWYPALDLDVRRMIFRFMQNVLDSPSFDPGDVNRYLAE
ncbi:MAG: phosphotransferase [Deltaproteobacteria bacterium]|nr:phosphotransferase [Deltaproteobacteria bacterium]